MIFVQVNLRVQCQEPGRRAGQLGEVQGQGPGRRQRRQQVRQDQGKFIRQYSK